MGSLWEDSKDRLVTPITDGSNRIQCIILKWDIVNILLCLCLYAKQMSERECINQLDELATKYIVDIYIVIGGNFNEDINSEIQTYVELRLLSPWT